MKFEPIAIVGSGCILPGCTSPDDLWKVVNAGTVNITEVPDNYWQVDLNKILTNKTTDIIIDHAYSTHGGYIRDFNNAFDPFVYAVPAELLQQLDPLVQWSCYATKQALTQAGYTDIAKHRDRAGIILGNLSYPSLSLSQLFANTYLHDLFPDKIPADNPHWLNRFGSGYPAILTAKALNLGGSAFCIDAACASSLYAVKLACDQLQNNQCDLMLAGGISASDSLFIHVGFSVLNAMDPQGRSRPFHKDAAGLVPAEGAAVIALKRLTDAIRDNNKILAVIRGIGLTNDGRSKNLLTPASEGQIKCMENAFKICGVKPSEVSYIECHATGTQVGDATEIESMSKIFNSSSKIPLGSLKANLGHLITASGTAGIIKVISAMQAKCIPATPNAYPVQDKIENSNFYVPVENKEWKIAGKTPTTACINSFGFGGNNACLIMQDGHSLQQIKTKLPKNKVKKNKVAIVALEIRTHQSCDTAEFFNQLIALKNTIAAKTDQLDASYLDIKKIAFPPKELKRALGQQIILLDLVEQLLTKTQLTRLKQTGVYIGMGVDPNVSRYGLRYRLQTILASHGIKIDKDWLEQAGDTIIGPMESGHILGAMPNMPANRINYQYACEGPGFTIAAEELSGDVALQLAVNAIECNELNSAIVGAIEVIDDKVHSAAIQKLLAESSIEMGEAAVVLILKNYEQAIKDGDKVLAIIDDSAQENNLVIKNILHESPLYKTGIPYSHAASGLLHIATATLLLAHKAKFSEDHAALIPALIHNEQFTYTVKNQSIFGTYSTTKLVYAENKPKVNFSLGRFPQLITYCASDRQTLLTKLKQNSSTLSEGQGNIRLAIVGYPEEITELKRQAIYQLENNLLKDGLSYKGICYCEQAIQGQLAFVYTGAASCYQGMGKELLLMLPALLDHLNEKVGNIYPYIDWIYKDRSPESELPFYQLAASSFLCQIHTIITRELLKLNPDAAIGLSSGETNYMFALDIWDGLNSLLEEIAASNLYTEHLGNQFTAVKQYWNISDSQELNWVNWHIRAPVIQVKQLLESEEKVYLTIIYTENECLISGDQLACQRIIQQLGSQQAVLMQHDLAVHCAAVKSFEQTWRQLHTRPVTPANIKCYSNYFGDSYALNSESVAQALTGQALCTIDFPKIINKAWQDGVRIFIEHGPKNSLTKAIQTILQGKPHLAIALDNTSASFKQLFDVAAQLWCAGVPINLNNLRKKPFNFPINETANLMEFPLHLPKIKFSAISAKNSKTSSPAIKTEPAMSASNDISNKQFKINTIAHFYENYTKLYKHALACQEAMFTKQSALHKQLGNVLIKHNASALTKLKNNISKLYPGPAFNRQQLEILASDKISSVFGSLFAQQDIYEIQCRMPEPPLLLCDRVLGIEGEAGKLGLGKIWTETDIKKDSWFIHCGRIVPGMMIESGQADLLLISWQGIDFLNQGKRAYRLLGCELTYRKSLPAIGDILRYEIKITGHANQGDVRLFFFEYDCYVKEEIVMSVRHGQAGFFSKEELANSAGVIWDPAKAHYLEHPKMQLSQNWRVKSNYTKIEIAAYTKGDLIACFGEHFLLTQTHTRTPQSLLGNIFLIEEINILDLQGGPKGRGYMRATTRVSADDWYFKGHFKNDPCMPGTLMAEAGMQAMAFYMTALGFTLNKDGWRFEPLTENQFKFICRGQAIPTSSVITYELFIEDIIAENYPIIRAYVLGSVDGQKAFLGEHLALRLVPDWPISSKLDLLENYQNIQVNYSGPLATLDGFKFNYESLIHSAWGKPSDAFGAVCRFHDDGLNRCPRLPGPPYHFMSRIIAIEAEFGKPQKGARIISEYDIPADAWYFTENAFPSMPYAVLMEIALQPCGWLSTFTQYNELKSMGEALFRNLDGEAKLYREITPADKIIQIEVTMLSSYQVSSTIIVNYHVICTIAEKMVYQLKTSFGFFSPAAFAEQKGLSLDEYDHAKRQLADHSAITIAATKYKTALPGPGLMMIDSVIGNWPQQGKYQKGLIRAKKIVKASDWYFKAHFFQDPVQPGSLGIEAMLQLLQLYMLENKDEQLFAHAHFEPVAVNETIVWHYRGQVVPYDKEIIIELDIITTEQDANFYMVKAEGMLWLNNLKIYHAPKLAMRLVNR